MEQTHSHDDGEQPDWAELNPQITLKYALQNVLFAKASHVVNS